MHKPVVLLNLLLGGCLIGCTTNGSHSDSSQGHAATPESDQPIPVTNFTTATNQQPETQIPFDQAPSVFRVYDSQLIQMVRNRWGELISGTPSGQWGVVKLQWRLFPDGGVSELRIASSTVDDKTAEMAKKMILDLAPFGSWPEEMRLLCTNGYRDIHFELSVQHNP